MESRFIEIPQAALDQVCDALREAGVDTMYKVLKAFDAGKITAEVRDALLEDVVDDLVEGAAGFVDVATPFDEPLETVTDAAIEAGKQAVAPLIISGALHLAASVEALLTRDAAEMRYQITRLVERVEEAKTDKQAQRRGKRVQRRLRVYMGRYPAAAHADGWRRHADGTIVKVND